MKIATKFIGVSVFLVGAIAFVSGGSTFWRNKTEQDSLSRYTQAKHRIQLVTQARTALHSCVDNLKDDVLFRNHFSIHKHQGEQEFEQSIQVLKTQMPSSEIDIVIQRYEIFKQLEHQLLASLDEPSPTAFADNQQDFRAINSIRRDIDFFLERVIKKASQDAQQSEQKLEQVRAIASVLSYATVIFLMLIVAAEFWLILRPIIRSLKELQAGAQEIGTGNLSYRLAISTQDEIEQVAQAFNQMAENLTQSQLLQQKLVELEVARTAAETANRTKSEFLANMNHELRTPLNGILGYTQILQRDPTTPSKQMKGLGVIHQCASHLLTLINDILDLSKLEVQKMELYPQDFHLANFLSSTVDICRVKAEQKGVTFHYQPAANLPTAVYADDKRLRQVLLNLLSNAVKFTDFGTVSFRIEPVDPRTVSERIHRLCFQVKDTGIGIAPDKLSTIFLPFEQAAKREHNTEGTGLGLAISQQIVEKMGSTIHVESVLGQGSCFWFEVDLPLASGWTAEEASTHQKISGYQGERRKILVIDDYPENCLVTVNLLEPLGFKLAEANNGQVGLEMAIQMRPDLIVTDVHMSVMDGLEMTRRLRQLPELATTPIIASPATLSQVDKQASLDAGCNSFLPKPIEINRLLAELQRLLQLQWIYETVPAQEPAITTSDEEIDLILPPAAELVALHAAIQGGFITDVQQEANRLKQLAPEYVNFANRVLELSQTFDDEAILRLLTTANSSC